MSQKNNLLSWIHRSMVKGILAVLVLGAIIVAGCKKDEVTNGPNGDGKKCVPTEVQIAGKTAEKYIYDSNGALATYELYSVGAVSQFFRFERNSDGNVTTVKVSNSKDEQNATYKYSYNDQKKPTKLEKYSHNFTSGEEKLMMTYDFVYNTNKIDTISYSLPSAEKPYLKVALAYDAGGNIISQKQYDNINKGTVNMEETITYDASPSIFSTAKIPFGAIGTDNLTPYSPNSPLEITRTDYKGGLGKKITKYGYERNSSGYPVKTTITVGTGTPVESTTSYNCK